MARLLRPDGNSLLRSLAFELLNNSISGGILAGLCNNLMIRQVVQGVVQRVVALDLASGDFDLFVGRTANHTQNLASLGITLNLDIACGGLLGKRLSAALDVQRIFGLSFDTVHGCALLRTTRGSIEAVDETQAAVVLSEGLLAVPIREQD